MTVKTRLVLRLAWRWEQWFVGVAWYHRHAPWAYGGLYLGPLTIMLLRTLTRAAHLREGT
jgi:hypothetical protein